MLKIPPGPPVTDTHSTRLLSTMMPKAIVTMARYGPETRSAAPATPAPTSAEIRMATRTAIHGFQPARTVRSAAV